MKKKIAGLLILLLLAWGSYWGWLKYAENQPQGIQTSGTIEAVNINLAAKLPGSLEFVSVKTGDTVKKGDTVAGIMRASLEAQKERDLLAVQKAEALLADMTAGSRKQELDEAGAALKTVQANYDQAHADYNRILLLQQNGAVSATDLEKAATALEVLANQLESAKSRVSLLESGARPSQITAARLELERSKAILKVTEASLNDTLITSPINGTVLSRNFEPGEFVNAGAAVVTVADLTDLWIKIFISTDDLPKIRLGQQVSYTVSGLPEKYTGTIVEIASHGQFTPKTIQTRQERTNIVYAVKVKIDSLNGVFKPGMPADVII